MGDDQFNLWLNEAIERWHELHHQSEPHTPQQQREFGDLTDQLAPHYKPAADLREKAGLSRLPEDPAAQPDAPPLPEEPGRPEITDPDTTELDEPSGAVPTGTEMTPPPPHLSDAASTAVPPSPDASPPDTPSSAGEPTPGRRYGSSDWDDEDAQFEIDPPTSEPEEEIDSLADYDEPEPMTLTAGGDGQLTDADYIEPFIDEEAAEEQIRQMQHIGPPVEVRATTREDDETGSGSADEGGEERTGLFNRPARAYVGLAAGMLFIVGGLAYTINRASGYQATTIPPSSSAPVDESATETTARTPGSTAGDGSATDDSGTSGQPGDIGAGVLAVGTVIDISNVEFEVVGGGNCTATSFVESIRFSVLEDGVRLEIGQEIGVTNSADRVGQLDESGRFTSTFTVGQSFVEKTSIDLNGGSGAYRVSSGDSNCEYVVSFKPEDQTVSSP